MAVFLKFVSGVYLIFVWFICAVILLGPSIGLRTGLEPNVGITGMQVLAIFSAIGLSIPAVALFGFAQIVGDVRIMRNNARLQNEHLAALRRYYEPTR
jgi:hypothetical protein